MNFKHELSELLPSFLLLCTVGTGSLLGCGSKLVSVGADYTGGSSSTAGSSSTGGSASTNPGYTGGTEATNGEGGSGNADVSILSAGDDDTTPFGGHWWTYTDHNPAGLYHAQLRPITSIDTPLIGVPDTDPSHGNVLTVAGLVPEQLPWQDVAAQTDYTIDSYWAIHYPDSKIPAYPAAGIGFDFLQPSRVFDATGGGKWVGIAFDLKINTTMSTLWVSMPMDGTSLPDPTYDAFPAHCVYYTTANAPADGYQTCFTHYRKGLHDGTGALNDYGRFGPLGSWKRMCVLYSEVGVPAWTNSAALEHLPQFDPTKLLKIQWDAYQPVQGEALFDISLDNVGLITAEQANDASNNCDPSMIGMPPGIGGQG